MTLLSANQIAYIFRANDKHFYAIATKNIGLQAKYFVAFAFNIFVKFFILFFSCATRAGSSHKQQSSSNERQQQ